MPLLETTGNSSEAAYGGGVAAVPNYIEDVFSTWLGTPENANTWTVNNGINLATYGGMVWTKTRTQAANHCLYDTVRGNGSQGKLLPNLTLAAVSTTGYATPLTFNTNGFALGAFDNVVAYQDSGVSWTFRKAPKFFDVVTFTQSGPATGNLTVNHSLGSVPGCIIIKYTNVSGVGSDWFVYHRSTASSYLFLNQTAAAAAGVVCSNVTSTSFDFSLQNFGSSAGTTFVAYLFAHNAGGFGLTGTDNVISCGSFTAAGSTTDTVVTLGYEPQLIIARSASSSDSWYIYDTMRGMSYTSTSYLFANTSAAEGKFTTPYGPRPTPTGFIATNSFGWSAGEQIIYIAIRRGPMKVPTSGTSVFTPVAWSGDGVSPKTFSLGINPDTVFFNARSRSQTSTSVMDKLRGTNAGLITSYAGPETTGTNLTTYARGYISAFLNTGFEGTASGYGYQDLNNSGDTYVGYGLVRAPSFFDAVVYTGTGSTQNITHNLAAAPQVMLVHQRTPGSTNWVMYHSSMGNGQYFYLNTGNGVPTTDSTMWNSTSPTASVFTVGTNSQVNNSASSYVAYLWAALPGVTSVGTYTGNGTSQTINCGFTSGARFVLVWTDSGSSYNNYGWLFDTARGMVAANDNATLFGGLNGDNTPGNSSALVTTSVGFTVNGSNAVSTLGTNRNGGVYYYLAIA